MYEYLYKSGVPAGNLQAVLNEAAAAGWRVVQCGRNYEDHGQHQGDYFWLILECEARGTTRGTRR